MRRATGTDTEIIWNHISGILLSYGIVANPDTTDRDLKDIDGNFGGDHGEFYLLLDHERLIGTVAFRLSPPDGAEICRMYLAESHRGKGLGKSLLDFITGQAERTGVRRLYVKTARVLEDAISLYRKSGFIMADHGHRDGNCDVLMEKILTRKARLD